MTTFAPAPVPSTLAGPVTFARVCRSEWTKFRSLRSSWMLLGAATVTSVLIAALRGDHLGGKRPDVGAERIAEVSQSGQLLAQLAILVLAALFVTGEYGTGMIRSSLTAVPRRLPVLLAKVVVVSVVVAVVTSVTAVLSFVASTALYAAGGHPSTSLTDPAALQIVGGSALYLTLAAVLAVGAAAVVRSTAGTITALLAVFFVAPILFVTMPGLLKRAKWLPSNAGATMSHQALDDNSLGSWVGMGLFALYTAVLLVAAARRLARSDV